MPLPLAPLHLVGLYWKALLPVHACLQAWLVRVQEAPGIPPSQPSMSASLQALKVQVPKPPLQTLGRRPRRSCCAAAGFCSEIKADVV